MIIPHSPASIEGTKIFECLTNSDPKDGLLNLAQTFINTANPIADSIISGPFHKYTLHNRDHIKKVFHIAGYIISPLTLEILNPAECLILLYTAYIHDMGMAITEEEFKGYLVNPAYLESIENWPEIKIAFDRNRELLKTAKDEKKQLHEAEIADLQKAALANYLRPLHATKQRYISLIQQIKKASGRQDIFEINGQSFESELISICESHNLNSTVLGEMKSAHEDRFPRALPIGGFYVNTQFVAALLRLSDVMDFDYERTPKSLFESLGIKHSTLPGAEVSLFEWQKHLSVHTIEISSDEIIISGVCKHPVIEAGIRDFCHIIENEIQDTLAILRRNSTSVSDKYHIILPPVVRANLRSEGYVYMNLALKLDEFAVMSLLMGNRLYNSPLVAIRELIQNAVDACVVRTSLLGESDYKPLVLVKIEKDLVTNDISLTVKDNGIGMDEYVLKQHFFRVGSSYYKSPEYKRLYRSTSFQMPMITSKFGIGFLSTFMIGNEVGINTRKIYPGGGTSKGNKIFIERMGALAFVQEDETLPIGTSVKVKFNDPNITSGQDYIREFISSNILRPMATVEFTSDSKSLTIYPQNYYSLNISPKSEIFLYDLEVFELFINRTDGIEGKVIFVLFKSDSGGLSYNLNDQTIEITTSSPNKNNLKIDPYLLINDFDGNRITVGGMKMSFPNLSKLFRTNKKKVAVIYDLDFSPNDDVDFNVARTKILDEKLILRKKLRNTIINCLKKEKYYDKFDFETQNLFSEILNVNPFNYSLKQMELRLEKHEKNGGELIDESTLSRVEKLLPKSQWPNGIHRSIAEELNISRGLAFNAITVLIVTERIKNPNYNL